MPTLKFMEMIETPKEDMSQRKFLKATTYTDKVVQDKSKTKKIIKTKINKCAKKLINTDSKDTHDKNILHIKYDVCRQTIYPNHRKVSNDVKNIMRNKDEDGGG